MNVIAKLRGLSTPAKIAIAAAVAVAGLVALYFGSRYAAGAAGVGLFGIIAETLGGRRARRGGLPDREPTVDLAGRNLEIARHNAANSNRESDARTRDRAADREAEAEARAVAAGADDGDDPNLMLDRQTRAGRRRRGD